MGWLTETDVQNYGNELLDVTQRAALHAVQPHLAAIEQQNEALRQQLAKEARRGLDAAVERALPNYRETDRDPRWHHWLLQIDPLTGTVRQQLLNAAIARSDATAVVAFFKGFMREVGNTQAPAASSRARSSGNKPIYTRAQVKELYAQHQRGGYIGREQEWARLENSIIEAGRENRILGGVDVAGK